MNILLTGVTGMLGTEVCIKLLKSGHNVYGVSKSLDRLDASLREIERNFQYINCDLSCLQDYQQFQNLDVGMVIHCAALTDVDACQTDRKAAQLNNIVATELLSGFCLRMNLPMVFISTDYVFSGTKKFLYTEQDKIDPVNFYGQSKAEAEGLIRCELKRHIILRTSWLYGLKRTNFVSMCAENLSKGKPVKAFYDLVGSPTYASDLAEGICKVVEIDGEQIYGTFHAAGATCCSRYEFALYIAKLVGADSSLVNRVKFKDSGLPARRPKYSALDSTLFEKTFGYLINGYRDSVKMYLKALMKLDDRNEIILEKEIKK